MIKEVAHDDNKKGVPEGLLPNPTEKNIGESQMAEFASTPIEEVMPGPNQMLQDEVQGPPRMVQAKRQPRETSGEGSSSKSKNPFGLTDDQYQAALAGVAAVIAFSKPVQGKLSTMVPKFLNEAGDMSVTGMVVTALIAAIVFYLARKYITP
jgi:hypothetical protein